MYDLLMFRDDFPPTLLIFSKQNLPKCQIQPTLTRFHKSLLAKTTNKEQITGNSVGLLQQMEIYPDVWQWLRAKSSHQPHPCWSIRRSILSIFRVQKLANILKSIPWKKRFSPPEESSQLRRGTPVHRKGLIGWDHLHGWRDISS